jgi:ABC-type sulfate/molybdate transport systems ATPase subunit
MIHRTEEWLERLGIFQLRKRPANQLSGGEARRVALARAFVLQPSVLLLDEPFSALDRTSRNKLQDDLKSILAVAETTTIFSTHSETDVRKLADRKIELDGGILTIEN